MISRLKAAARFANLSCRRSRAAHVVVMQSEQPAEKREDFWLPMKVSPVAILCGVIAGLLALSLVIGSVALYVAHFNLLGWTE